MTSLSKIISFSPIGYPGTFLSLNLDEVAVLTLRGTTPLTYGITVHYMPDTPGDKWFDDQIRATDFTRICAWIDAHRISFQRETVDNCTVFRRYGFDSQGKYHGRVSSEHPEMEGPEHSILAFLTVDDKEHRLRATTLQWVSLMPIKGCDNFTLGYVNGTNLQQEHTITAACARDIERWIAFTKAFTRTKGATFATGGEWARNQLTAKQTLDLRGKSNTVSAAIDVKLEQVLTMAAQIGTHPEFISDIAPAVRQLLSLMIREKLAEDAGLTAFTNTRLGKTFADMEGDPTALRLQRELTLGRAAMPLMAGSMKGGFTPGGLPLEEVPRKGETPFGYVVGHLSQSALACLQDVVSHASDIRSALSVRREHAAKSDYDKTGVSEPIEPADAGDSYWKHQQDVHERMVVQAQEALDIHAKVSGK